MPSPIPNASQILVRDIIDNPPDSYKITKEELLSDLYRAYKDARQRKRRREYQVRFEMHLERELVKLRDELFKHIYTPSKSMCFIVTEPKQREVFAAHFRDRVVHHLFYNYTIHLFENSFIHDSYSCRRDRGTHFGIQALNSHIKSVSENYTKPCYVMKMDIEGYFMHIDRQILLNIVICTLDKYKNRRAYGKEERWRDVLDFSLIYYLAEKIILNDPTKDCYIRGSMDEWKGLPASKSMFHTPEGCGLPIGNLTSQLFSNIYLNALDQYVKRDLHCRHYGRYVDDFYIVADNKEQLMTLIAPIRNYLSRTLRLHLHPNKTFIYDIYEGVPFLGAFIKPYRKYVDNDSWNRIRKKLFLLEYEESPERYGASLNSLLGNMNHYSSYRLRKPLVLKLKTADRYGFYTNYLRQFIAFGSM